MGNLPNQAAGAVVFDLDGTLADTLRDLADATNAALAACGYPPCPLAAYPHMVGNGARKLIERALGPACTPEAAQRVYAAFTAVYDRDCLKATQPYPGMVQTVMALAEAGLVLLVVTNKPEKQALRIVDHLFPDRFAAVYGGREGRAAKPDPTATREALMSAGIPPERALFVGDSDVDVYTAHAAGIGCAGAVWGFRGREELAGAGADYLLEAPPDLLPLARRFLHF